MRTLPVSLAIALLTLAAGCDPCVGYTGTTFVDEAGAFEPGVLADLEVTYDAFVAATGPDRVCIARVEAEPDVNPAGSLVYGGPEWVIEVDPAEMFPTRALRGELCLALELRENIDPLADDLFGEGGFAGACACTHPDFAWLEEVTAACGVSPLSAEDQFMAEVAFPAAAVGRVDGPLAVSVGAPVRLVGVAAGVDVRGSAALGEGLLLHLVPPHEVFPAKAAPERVVYVDLATGVVTDLLSAPAIAALYGGPDGAVVRASAPDVGGTPLHAIDAATLAVTPLTASLQSSQARGGAVSEGVLYLAPEALHGYTTVEAVDLATGVVTEFALPDAAAPATVLPDELVPVPGGFVLAYSEAEVETNGDASTITVGDRLLVRWSAADAGWTELSRGVGFVPLGATTDGRLVGALRGAGDVLGAYTYEDDHFAVSADICLAETGRPDVVAGDRAWRLEVVGADVVLTPFLLD